MYIAKLKSELEKNGFELVKNSGYKGIYWYKIVPKNDNSKWVEWRRYLYKLNQKGFEDFILVLESTSNSETHVGFEFLEHPELKLSPEDVSSDDVKNSCNRNNLNWEISWSRRTQTKSRPFVREAQIEMGIQDYEEEIVKKVVNLMNTKGEKLLNVFKELLGQNIQNVEQENSQEELTSASQSSNPLAKKYAEQLKASKNIILHGAPGTGKTYLAKEIAKEMGCPEDEIGFVQFHQSYDYTDFVEGLRPAKGSDGKADGFERRDGVFKEYCKKAISRNSQSDKGEKEIENFKEIFDRFYKEVLITGKIELKTKSDQESFEVKKRKRSESLFVDKANGLTLNWEKIKDYLETGRCDYWKSYIPAVADYIKEKYENEFVYSEIKADKPFVFIIDEINRGEMSKIFGELFFSIDPGYRGEKGQIQTQYQNLIDEDDVFCDGFYVPENVYIIGTMNDIDRSVESMDFAMRRRFAFIEVSAGDSVGMLYNENNPKKGLGDNAALAKSKMEKLNEAIEKIEGLSSAYHIGPAYFLKLKDCGGDFGNLWNFHLKGVIKEYLRGMPDAENCLKELEAVYNKA